MGISYNFERFERIFSDLMKSKSPQNLRALKDELNKFFKDSKCEEVIYTNNNDNAFFGMCVLPSMDDDQALDIASGKFRRFNKYYLELDSKIFDPVLRLQPREHTALVLHEVGHVVNNVAAQKEISAVMNYSVGKNGVTFELSEVKKRPEVLNLGIARALRKITSIFEKDTEEFYADEFVVNCGYGDALSTAFNKIIKSRDLIKGNNNKFVSLIWSMTLYTNLSERRRTVIDQLEEGKTIDGSKLMQRRFDSAIKAIQKTIDKDIKERDTYDYIKEAANGFFTKIKFSPIKSLEEDMYEFKIRINNIQDNDEAMDMLRSINMRISLIAEYIKVNPDLDRKEVEKLNKMSAAYVSMREELIRKGSYDKGVYSIWVKYPELKNRYGSL